MTDDLLARAARRAELFDACSCGNKTCDEDGCCDSCGADLDDRNRGADMIRDLVARVEELETLVKLTGGYNDELEQRAEKAEANVFKHAEGWRLTLKRAETAEAKLMRVRKAFKGQVGFAQTYATRQALSDK